MDDIQQKIKALLGQGTEHEKLDYKKTLDIADTHELVEITKDIAAMLSSGGGSLLVGADDAGNPVNDLSDALFEKFDETKLRNKLKKYINEPLPIRAAAVQIDGFNHILIECDEHPDGFVILKAIGQYPDGVKTKDVFKPGDVFVRHGSASERWQQHDIERIVASRISKAKNSWLKDAELILTRIGQQNAPEVDEKRRLKELVNSLKDKVKAATLNQSDIQLALDEICLTAIKAVHNEEEGVFKVCVDSLVACYALGFDHKGAWKLTSSFNPVELWYAVLVRLPLVGGACVEAKLYAYAKYIILQNVPGDDGRHYRTWYRHALTMSSRGNYTPRGSNGEGRSFLSATTNFFRTDIQYKNALNWDDEEGRTFIVSFDYLATLVILDDLQRIDTSEFYTSFAFYDKDRITQMLVDILLNEKVRESLFKSQPEQLAYIAKEVDDVAYQEEGLYWDKGDWRYGLTGFMATTKPF